MLLIPYRAKNPPESVPYVTIGLIALNTLVYLATADYSNYGLSVRESAVQALAISDNHFTLWRLVTATFLHENLEHIGGNMLFLWVFGSAVEGRLKHALFLVVYLLCGLGAGLLHEVVVGMYNPSLLSLGASGAIMGVLACYLYMFPHSAIRIFFFSWWGFYVRMRIFDWPAWGIILFYIGFDFLNGFLFGGRDGVGHFAHIGGFAMGLLCMLIVLPRRDSEDYSQVQATRSDAKDYALLGYTELETLMEHPRGDAPLIMTFCEKAMMEPTTRAQEVCVTTLREHARLLIEQAEPERLARLIMNVPQQSLQLPLVYYLRLASRLEHAAANELALHVYWRIYETDPHAQDSERALYRFGQIMEGAYADKQQAMSAYEELLKLFPQGGLAPDTRRALARLNTPAPALPATSPSPQTSLPTPQNETTLQPTSLQNGVGGRASYIETD